MWQREPGETNEHLIYRICSHKDSIGSWQDVRDLLNKLLDQEYSESAYRKRYQIFSSVFNSNRDLFGDESKELKELQQELEKARVKLRDERRAYRKDLAIEARVEAKLDLLEQGLEDFGKRQFPPLNVSSNNNSEDSDKVLMVCLSDLHIGAYFRNNFGTYDLETAKQRLDAYVFKVIEIGALYRTKTVYINLLGDLISGNIHFNLQVSNNENIIKQVEDAAEMITAFIYNISLYFDNVIVNSVDGNHSRLVENKEAAIHDERLDNLIYWIVKSSLKQNQKVQFGENNLDQGIATFEINDRKWVIVHGDYDFMGKQGIASLVTFLGFTPDYVVSGHKHFPAYDQSAGIPWIQSGSLSGSGDQYTVEKRLYNNPSQTTLVLDEGEIECIYNVDLS